MLLSLNYGRGELALEIPEQNILAYRQPIVDSTSGNPQILLDAINDFGILRISPIFAGRQVGVILEDATSPAELLAVMLPFLRGARAVQFLLAASSAESNRAANQRRIETIQAMIAAFEFPDYEIHVNDRDKDEFVTIGRTARGTPVRVNEFSSRCDVFLAIAAMQNHECAGYATPLQNFLPGLCNSETLRHNEALALDERATFGTHPFHPDPLRRNNPLAEDGWEGVQMILRRRPVLALTVISAHGQLQWAKIGALIEATRAGMQKVDELMSAALPPADYLVVSPGGYPDDENFYTSLRALLLTRNGILPNGEVLFLAHCENGVGPQQFYHELTKPLPEILQRIENDDQRDYHRAYQFAAMLQQLRAIHVHSTLPDDVIECIRLHPCAEPQAVVNQWLAKNPPAKIIVLNGAIKLARP